MLFNSFEFLIFLPLVSIAFFILPHRFRWILLLIASYYFYMYWEPVYALLLAGSTFLSYYCSYRMSQSESHRRRLAYLYLSILASLSILFVFKYLNFANESLKTLFEAFNMGYALPALHIILPVGVSFYLFQNLSYNIDVYNKKIEAEKHLGIYALYISFFPQLVAGPIERAGNIIPQLKEKHYFDYKRVTDGIKLIVWGLFKKVIVADRIAAMVNEVYSNPTGYEGAPLILATVLFSFQIYCDFSGYSDIAIGSAQIMGINLMDNFRRPYFSKSISEFWQRWHISLSSWLKDYIYIPLGGNRVVKWRWYYNLFITFFISGLWHGAAWTFVIWGVLHGTYMIAGAITADTRARLAHALRLHKAPFIHKLIQVGVTFGLITFAWIFFRSNSITDAWYIVTHLFTNFATTLSTPLLYLGQNGYYFWITILAIILMESVHLIQRHGSIRHMLSKQPLALRWGVYFSLIFSIVLFSYTEQYEFIYFQF